MAWDYSHGERSSVPHTFFPALHFPQESLAGSYYPPLDYSPSHYVGYIMGLPVDNLSRVQGAEAAEGDVEDAAVLASVNVFAGEHLIADLLTASFADKIEDGCEDGMDDQVLEIVEEEDVG